MTDNKQETKLLGQISRISFGIYSPEEMRKMGIKINNSKLSGENSVYDERLGKMTENSGNCASCKLDYKHCPSHFGYIELNEYIIHPLYYKVIISLLKCICYHCKKLVLLDEQLLLSGLQKYTKKNRFTRILDKITQTSTTICAHCLLTQPKVTYYDNNIHLVYRNQNKERQDVILEAGHIKKILDSLTDDQVELLGIDPTMAHPKHLILSVLPVLPPACRPYAISDGSICDDDLTNQLIEIIKLNDKLGKLDTNVVNNGKRLKLVQSLKFKIATLYDNSKGKAKHQTNNKPIKGLKERISGKDGIIRNNLMGKRVNFSARTVLGADPEIGLNQVVIPTEVAEILTIPIPINAINITKMNKLVEDGKVNIVIRDGKKINIQFAIKKSGTMLYPSDVIIRDGKEIKYQTVLSTTNLEPIEMTIKHGDQVIRDGVTIPCTYPSTQQFALRIGDIAERQLMDDDTVLINRQPTLHAGSMIAMKAVIKKNKTFRINLACTKSLNADFDGDELNLHVPQSIESRAELETLSMAKHHMITPQTSKPNICIVQDGLLGVYKMTNGIQKVSRDACFNITMVGSRLLNGIKTELWNMKKIEHIRAVYKKFGKNYDIFNGKTLFSLILPDDLNYQKHNNNDKSEPIVKIYKGVLYEGTIDKAIVGSTHGSILQILNKDYGCDITSEFIDNLIFMSNAWLSHFGFSVGLKDCMLENEKANIKIQSVITRSYMETKQIEETTNNHLIKEIRTTAALNRVKDVGMKIATDAMPPDNNFLSTVYAGSKGDFFNISQVTGLLGQQTIDDKRIMPTLNHGTRALPHYNYVEKDPILKYESMGFIRNSFIKGLNPCEMFFHNCAGRLGIINTALTTAKSGYCQRRIVKITEDIQVQTDQTVRDVNGNIYQLSYNNNIDPRCTVNNNTFCNITTIVNKLNQEYESDDDELEITTK